MFGRELQKLFGKQITQVLFLIVLIGNGLLLYINETTDTEVYRVDASAYVALQNDLKGLSDEEKEVYIEQGILDVDMLQNIMTYQVFGGYDEELWETMYPEVSYEDAVKKYEEGSYLRYTENFIYERALYQEVGKEIEQVRGYPDYVKTTLESTLSSLKNMEDRNSYVFRNLTAIYFAFDGVKDVQTSYGPARGIRGLTDNLMTDLWAVLFLFMMAVLLVTVEREKKLLILVKSTKDGRGKLGIQKLLVLYASCALIMLLHVENFILMNGLYGMGDLGRSIQSVTGFQSCTIKVSVGKFLLLCFFVKLLFYLMCVSLFYFICTLFMKSLWVYAIVIGVAVCSGILYSSISNTSNLFLIKAISPFGLVRVNEILGSYKNLRLGEFVVDRVVASLVVLSVITVISATAGVLCFALKKEKESRVGGFHPQLFRKLLLYEESHTFSFVHESHKVFIVQHVLLILVVAGAFIYMTFRPITAENSAEDIYYKEFVQRVEGPAEAVSQEDWNRLMQQYEEQYALAAGTGNTARMSNIQEAMRALERVVSHGTYLETKSGSWYLYDGGYELLTGINYRCEMEELLSVLFIAVIGVFCFSGIYSIDYQNGGIRLLRSTQYGRGTLTANKMGIGVLVAAAIFVLAWFPQMIFTLRTYGTGGLEAPVYSIERLSWLPKGISIGGYLILLYVIRYIGILSLMLLTFAVTAKMRHFIISCCTVAGIVLLPVSMALLKVKFMKYVLLTPLLLGDMLFLDSGISVLALCLAQELVILVFSIWLLKKT